MRRVCSAMGLLFLCACSVPKTTEQGVHDFLTCSLAGFPVMESYPRQCRGPDGTLYVEDVSSSSAEAKDIRVTKPAANTHVANTFDVVGEARGTWFFEASFPWYVEDGDGNVLVRGVAQTTEDWMTESMVPFSITITLPSRTSGRGVLVLQKDNPSGLPENDNSLRIPLRF